jgi:hypothetical protein
MRMVSHRGTETQRKIDQESLWLCVSVASRGIAVAVLALIIAQPLSPASAAGPAVQSMERKLDHIESNAQAPAPDSRPTVMTEEEVNAYVNSGAVQLPRGVQRVRLEGQAGVVTAHTRVDFDQITQGGRSINPLLALFSGVHDVEVTAHAHGERGVGHVHADHVILDGVEVPQMALQFFVDRYLKPKYPEIGIDSRFQMPDRIDSAIVGQHQVSVVQK